MASVMRLGFHTWREDLARYKIQVLSEHDVIDKARELTVLPVCNCSAAKGVEEAIPRLLYTGQHSLRFYNWCESLDLKYGVLSDLYGLLLWNEKAKSYDIHPSSLTKQKYRKLASKIFFKMESIGCNQFLYYGIPPVSCRPYFYMMIVTGLPIFYTTKLPKEL